MKLISPYCNICAWVFFDIIYSLLLSNFLVWRWFWPGKLALIYCTIYPPAHLFVPYIALLLLLLLLLSGACEANASSIAYWWKMAFHWVKAKLIKPSYYYASSPITLPNRKTKWHPLVLFYIIMSNYVLVIFLKGKIYAIALLYSYILKSLKKNKKFFFLKSKSIKNI